MKKLLFVAMCLMAVVACKQEVQQPVIPDGGQNDSLQRIIEQKDNEINDLVGTLYEIQEGFREINEAEKRVSVAKSGERADQAQQIRENIQFIADRMAKNRELIQKLQKQLDKYDMPKGYRAEITGETESVNKVMRDMLLMILISIALIYLIMVAQFRSFLSPFIVMFTIPLAYTGGFIALFIARHEISMLSMMGFLMLAGRLELSPMLLLFYPELWRRH